MDKILFEVFLKNIDLSPQHTYYNGTIYIIDNIIIVLSVLVESSGYSSTTVKKDRIHMRLWTRFYGRLS